MGQYFEIEYYPKLKNKQIEKTVNIINKRKEKWDSPFFSNTESYLDLGQIKEVISSLKPNNIKNIIVLGTGGSIQTFLALKHLSKKKIYPITSSRAIELKSCFNNTNPEDSIVIPISRGGETLDVNSTIGTFLKRGYNFLGLSSMGTMNEILKKIGCPILDVPDLSGRFAASISNVAIVPAYFADINIDDFLEGLKEGYEIFMNYRANPALEFSALMFHLYNLGYKIVFSMPYSINLEGVVGLFVQEISESSGKDNKGLMGAYQSAPLCQHSVLEYLLGGMKGAVFPVIWTVESELLDLTLDSSIDYVNGETAQSIINYQADATFQALIEETVPSAKISLKAPDALNVGQIIAFIQSSVYYTCLLLDANWANNPKVEIGKNICNEALIHKYPRQKRRENRRRKAEDNFKNFF